MGGEDPLRAPVRDSFLRCQSLKQPETTACISARGESSRSGDITCPLPCPNLNLFVSPPGIQSRTCSTLTARHMCYFNDHARRGSRALKPLFDSVELDVRGKMLVNEVGADCEGASR